VLLLYYYCTLQSLRGSSHPGAEFGIADIVLYTVYNRMEAVLNRYHPTFSVPATADFDRLHLWFDAVSSRASVHAAQQQPARVIEAFARLVSPSSHLPSVVVGGGAVTSKHVASNRDRDSLNAAATPLTKGHAPSSSPNGSSNGSTGFTPGVFATAFGGASGPAAASSSVSTVAGSRASPH